MSKLLGFFDSFNRIQISRCPDVNHNLENSDDSHTQDVATQQRDGQSSWLAACVACQKLNAIHDDWLPRCHFAVSVQEPLCKQLVA